MAQRDELKEKVMEVFKKFVHVKAQLAIAQECANKLGKDLRLLLLDLTTFAEPNGDVPPTLKEDSGDESVKKEEVVKEEAGLADAVFSDHGGVKREADDADAEDLREKKRQKSAS